MTENPLLSRSEYKHNTHFLETTITLQESNSLRIELESIPNSYLTIEIIQDIPDPVYDLQASDLQVDTTGCPDSLTLNLQVTNIGEDEIAEGLQVSFYNGDPQNGGTLIGTTATTAALAPSDSQDISLQWNNPETGEAVIYAVVDDDGSGTETYTEVDEANNTTSTEAFLCQVLHPAPAALRAK